MWNILREVELEEDEWGFKIGERNINNLHLADDTLLIAKSTKDLQFLVIIVKEQNEKWG